MKKIIIIGGTSGIGKALAQLFHQKGWVVGITGRRTEKLKEIKEDLKERVFVQNMDISNPEESQTKLIKLTKEMNEVDVVIISAGTGYLNKDLEWRLEKETIQVNVMGFVGIATEAMKIVFKQKKGHLVGISSIGALIGNKSAPAYNASKAFISNYMNGLRNNKKCKGNPIYVTDVRPGFVETDMAKGATFWVSSVEKAARQIYKAIDQKKKCVYVSRRWKLIAWIIQLLPSSVVSRFF